MVTCFALQSAPVISPLQNPDPIVIAPYGAHTVPSHFEVAPDRSLTILKAVALSEQLEPLPCTSV